MGKFADSLSDARAAALDGLTMEAYLGILPAELARLFFHTFFPILDLVMKAVMEPVNHAIEGMTGPVGGVLGKAKKEVDTVRDVLNKVDIMQKVLGSAGGLNLGNAGQVFSDLMNKNASTQQATSLGTARDKFFPLPGRKTKGSADPIATPDIDKVTPDLKWKDPARGSAGPAELILPPSSIARQKSPLMDDVFEFAADNFEHGDFRVVSFTGTEELSGLYRFDVELTCPGDGGFTDGMEQKLLGQKATFTMNGGGRTYRATKGYVSRVRVHALGRDGRARVSVALVPKLAFLALNKKSRIFQDLTVRQIVDAVLDKWQLKRRWQLVKDYAARTYVTQYGESDLDFVRRVLAMEGIFYYAEHAATEPGADASEDVVFIDSAHGYPKIPDADGSGGATLGHYDGRFEMSEAHVNDFALQQEVAPSAVLLGDFDFRKPQLGVSGAARTDGGDVDALAKALGYEQFQEYLHADWGEFENDQSAHEVDDARAAATLQQLRRERVVGQGTSRCRRISPGRTFTMEGHAVDGHNQEYVVTRVTHKGLIPERAGGADGTVYENRFECVPSAVSFHIADSKDGRTRSLERARQVTETATVVGPSGEEIWRDGYGRVKIQFHWDLDGKSDEHSSCWVRVASPWAGARWGAEFTPRVGMEVLVSFLGGDVDRPIVVGCLYNGTHPTPWHLPEEKTRSGIRTQSVGGEGHNEVSFEDAKGREKLTLSAQKDLLTSAKNDYSLDVGRDMSVDVKGRQTLSIGGGQTVLVRGDSTQTIEESQTITVQGDALHAISGNSDTRVTGILTARVEGDEKREVFSSSELAVHEDRIVRVTGHAVTIVGQHDAKRSNVLHVEGQSILHSAGPTELTSDTQITLRCGKTSIVMKEDTIEISSPSILLKGDDFALEAEKTVKVISKKEQTYQGEKLSLRADKVLSLKAEKASIALEKIADRRPVREAELRPRPARFARHRRQAEEADQVPPEGR